MTVYGPLIINSEYTTGSSDLVYEVNNNSIDINNRVIKYKSFTHDSVATTSDTSNTLLMISDLPSGINIEVNDINFSNYIITSIFLWES